MTIDEVIAALQSASCGGHGNDEAIVYDNRDNSYHLVGHVFVGDTCAIEIYYKMN